MGDIEVHVSHKSLLVSPGGVYCRSCHSGMHWNSGLLSILGRVCAASNPVGLSLPLTLFLSLDLDESPDP